MELVVPVCEVEVLTAGTVKITVFSDVTPPNLVDIYQHFRETGWLDFLGRKEEDPEDGGRTVLENVELPPDI
jgi:hypothetical protein